jgi:hypothetical protein
MTKPGSSPHPTGPSTSGHPATENLAPSLSTLMLSIGSTCIMAMGLAPNPATGKIEKDLQLARFNIDLLSMLQEKTKGNLSPEEEKFMSALIHDLRMKFVQAN